MIQPENQASQLLASKSRRAIKLLENHRKDYSRQVAERIRRIERYIENPSRNDPQIMRVILNPLEGL